LHHPKSDIAVAVKELWRSVAAWFGYSDGKSRFVKFHITGVRHMQSIFNKNIFLSMAIAAALFCSGTSQAKEPASVPSVQSVQSVQMETLLRSGTSWDGTPYTAYPQGAPELTVLKITIPPHSSLPWHTHPMPNAAYVLSGELTVEKKENGEKKVLTAGQVLPEMVDALHRGTTGDLPVVLIVFYAGIKDMPLSRH
jgi:quercetin dioxygenase-like cupin family protein